MLVKSNEKHCVVYERRRPNDLTKVLAALSLYGKEVQGIAVESTYTWYWLVGGLMEAGDTVKLVNTVAMKTDEGLEYTGDENDARH